MAGQAEPGTLSGLRVLDISTGLSGATTSRLLAAFGAEVIKVEQPGSGDPARELGPFSSEAADSEASGLFAYLNGGKRGVTLDWSRDAGREILLKLLERADVLVENMGAQQASSLGLDHTSLRAVNDQLIVGSLTDFGSVGPYAGFKATQLVLAAMSGWLYQTGVAGRPPVKAAGELLTASVPGIYLAVGILAAEQWRSSSGRGQAVSVSAMEALLHFTRYYETTYAYFGMSLGRGQAGGVYRCQDGWVVVQAITDAQWELLFQLLGQSHLLDTPEFRTNADRMANRDAMRRLMEGYFRDKGRKELFQTMQEWRIPAGFVATSRDVLALEQHEARDYFIEQEVPGIGHLRIPRAPVALSESPGSMAGAAPKLGEHNRQVYGELGLSSTQMADLRAGGVI